MSSENVEIVRRIYASWTRTTESVRRPVYLAVFDEFFHPNAELVPPSIYPDTEPSYRGVEGFLRFQQQLDDIWHGSRAEAERFFDAGEQVVVFTQVSGTAKQSQAAVAMSTAHLLTLKDGRVVRTEIFLDRHEALKAAGLAQ